MPKLPRVSGAELIRALTKLGFVKVRQKGSHVILKKMTISGEIGCVVPLHKELARGTLHGILKQAQIEISELLRQVRR